MKSTTFTSTISARALDWLNEESKKQKRTRRAILEEALLTYKREMMRKGFRADAANPDILELAELGMDDYAKLLRNI